MRTKRAACPDWSRTTRARRLLPVLTWQAEKASTHAAQQARSRDKWRAALVEVMAVHEENPRGGCTCGAKVFPCVTWKTLERVNKGIMRQVDEFLAMPDEERDQALYGDAA